MVTSRRCFIGSMLAFGAAGCRTGLFDSRPNLRFGVVSDIHITTPESTALFEKSLRYFDGRGVDAVMVPGDLADGGNIISLRLVAKTWQRVFPGNRGSDGRPVIPLFCTGNHDFDGFTYGDMKRDLDANGLGHDTQINKAPGGMKAVWEEIFGEPYAPVRVRTVKGYDFVSAEWDGFKNLDTWMAENGKRFKGDRPFFVFQHPPMRGTTSDSFRWADEGHGLKALTGFPNAVAFTGHAHRPFCDEKSIWQGAFTAIATPSLSYAGFPEGHENGERDRTGKATNAMPMIPARRDLRGGQGFVVSVWDERIEIERVDLEENGEQDLPPWIFPVSVRARPYAEEPRAAASVAPEFPVGSRLVISTRNTENAQGRWTIVLHCAFPSAVPAAGTRVFDYEVRAVPTDGSEPCVKRFLSPAYHKLARFEPPRQEFWFSVDELPKAKPYRIEVRAFNCFGKASKPLVSSERPSFGV